MNTVTDAAHPRFRIKPLPVIMGLKIALVQLAVGPDKKKNIANAIHEIHKAKAQGAQLVALPECFNSPYGTKYFAEYSEEVPTGETSQALSRAATEAGVCVVAGTIPERSGNNLYNTCTVWDVNGKLLAKHRKIHLFDIDIPGKITFKESETLSAGDKLTTFDYQGIKIGLGICYDVRFQEIAQLMADQDGSNLDQLMKQRSFVGLPHPTSGCRCGTQDLFLPHARTSSRQGYDPDGLGGNGPLTEGSISWISNSRSESGFSFYGRRCSE
ncbi:Omega-amidase NIT2 [Eumeta japonica]|uniref:omega-amidase n=1 Tax=Eumeta variegata TaxID=151549 RepID=A0A4C2A6P4_EUMVA|nr:Omega-amidase NIT2 [Eumeta japonica]